MSQSRQHRDEVSLKRVSHLAPALALVIVILLAAPSNGQSNRPPSTFHAGQSLYIVAFRPIQYPIVLDDPQIDPQREYINYDLGRFLIGPLKLPTLSRLSDRLVKQFREKVSP